MKFQVDRYDSSHIRILREQGDRREKRESSLLLSLRRTLQGAGFDVIKKLMWKDGHLVSEHQHYVRSREKGKSASPTFSIWSGNFAIEDASTPWNKDGEVELLISFDIFADCGDPEASARENAHREKFLNLLREKGLLIEK